MALEKTVSYHGFTKGLSQAEDENVQQEGFLDVLNLVQDEFGCWVARPGTKPNGPYDSYGEAFYHGTFGYGTNDGQVLYAANLGQGYPLRRRAMKVDETSTLPTMQGLVPEFGVQIFDAHGVSNDTVLLGACSFYNYYLVVTQLGGLVNVSVYDKQSGNRMREYQFHLRNVSISGNIQVHARAVGTSCILAVVDLSDIVFRHVVISGTALPTGLVFTTTAWPSTFTPFNVVSTGGASVLLLASPSDVVAIDTTNALVASAFPLLSADAITSWGDDFYTAGISGIEQWTYSAGTLSSLGVSMYSPASFSPNLPVGFAVDGVSVVGSELRLLVSHGSFQAVASHIFGISGCQVLFSWSKGVILCEGMVSCLETGRHYALMRQGIGGIGGQIPSFPLSAPFVFSDVNGRLSVHDVTEHQGLASTDALAASPNEHLFSTARHVCTLDTDNVLDCLSLSVGKDGLPECTWIQQVSGTSKRIRHGQLLGDSMELHAVSSPCGAIVTGGSLTCFDGNHPNSCGFIQRPFIHSAVSSSHAGGLGPGQYKYVAVYRYVAGDGTVIRSETGNLVLVPVTIDSKVDLVIEPPFLHDFGPPPNVSGEIDRTTVRVEVELYRSPSNGEAFYLVQATPDITLQTPSLGVSVSSGSPRIHSKHVLTIEDRVPDSVLVYAPKLYRQPGSVGSALNRNPPPPSSHGCIHGDRVFLVSADGKTIYYSSFFVQGESPWFSPAFTLSIPDGGGKIVGVASLKGRLLIFKDHGVFAVDGDGPPENGGSGTEYSTPVLISYFGCTGSRSILETDRGVVFMSHKGLMTIDVKGEISPIGEQVIGITRTLPTVKWSIWAEAEERLYFGLSEYVTYQGKLGPTGNVVCMDLRTGLWSRFTYYSAGRGNQHAPEFLWQARASLINGSQELTLYSWDYGSYWMEHTADIKLDISGIFIPRKLVSTWRQTGGPDGRQRIYDYEVIGKYKSPSTVKLSFAYNFHDLNVQEYTWEDTVIQGLPGNSVRQLNLQPNTQATISTRFTYEETAPNSLALGDGKGMELFGLGVELGSKPGLTKIGKDGKG